MTKKNTIKGVPKDIPVSYIKLQIEPSQHAITIRQYANDFPYASIGCSQEYEISEWLNDPERTAQAKANGYSSRDINDYRRILTWVAKFLGSPVKLIKKQPTKKKKPATKKAVKKTGKKRIQ